MIGPALRSAITAPLFILPCGGRPSGARMSTFGHRGGLATGNLRHRDECLYLMERRRLGGAEVAALQASVVFDPFYKIRGQGREVRPGAEHAPVGRS